MVAVYLLFSFYGFFFFVCIYLPAIFMMLQLLMFYGVDLSKRHWCEWDWCCKTNHITMMLWILMLFFIEFKIFMNFINYLWTPITIHELIKIFLHFWSFLILYNNNRDEFNLIFQFIMYLVIWFRLSGLWIRKKKNNYSIYTLGFENCLQFHWFDDMGWLCSIYLKGLFK